VWYLTGDFYLRKRREEAKTAAEQNRLSLGVRNSVRSGLHLRIPSASARGQSPVPDGCQHLNPGKKPGENTKDLRTEHE